MRFVIMHRTGSSWHVFCDNNKALGAIMKHNQSRMESNHQTNFTAILETQLFTLVSHPFFSIWRNEEQVSSNPAPSLRLRHIFFCLTSSGQRAITSNCSSLFHLGRNFLAKNSLWNILIIIKFYIDRCTDRGGFSNTSHVKLKQISKMYIWLTYIC